MNNNDLIKKLKEKGIKLKLEDGSCGCCSYTNVKIEIDGEVFEADRGNRADNANSTDIDTGDL